MTKLEKDKVVKLSRIFDILYYSILSITALFVLIVLFTFNNKTNLKIETNVLTVFLVSIFWGTLMIVLNRYQMKYSNLIEKHRKQLKKDKESNYFVRSINFLRKNDIENFKKTFIFVKDKDCHMYLSGLFTGYNLNSIDTDLRKESNDVLDKFKLV